MRRLRRRLKAILAKRRFMRQRRLRRSQPRPGQGLSSPHQDLFTADVEGRSYDSGSDSASSF
ncbi:hypothetical protein [Streptosporangium carneum]|uniref:hypothetical protein n=1 Tax=Streptosporangium carneum TaxID=47481 RepID=UPI0022F2E3B3|nr:hypothetical protein [Streptosporangium carneum]